jgi:electron transfer flavoprotein alpha subunit
MYGLKPVPFKKGEFNSSRKATMADRILVVAEQREGKLNRVSLETLAAAQAIGKEAGWPVEVVLPGYHTTALAQELAGHRVEKVYDLDAASL